MKKSVIFGLLLITMIGGISIISASCRLVYDPPPPPPVPPDSDGDGLTNATEIAIGTNPYNSDTDSDGLSDYKEYLIYHTNPLKKDTDGDSLNDKDEITYGFNPNYVEATHMFVHDGTVYCGVAYVAWVSNYWMWELFLLTLDPIQLATVLIMLAQLDGDLSLDALDGSDDARYDYVGELEARGYYVITDSNFNTISYVSNFVTAYNFAKQYNTRLFAITYTHGMPISLDIPSIKGNWMTFIAGMGIGPSTFVEIGLLTTGSIPELVFYASPCYSMTTMSLSITASLALNAGTFILFGTFNPGTQSAVHRFLDYGIERTAGIKSVYDAYQLAESASIGFIGSTSYVLPIL